MEFDADALNGIIDALSPEDRAMVHKVAHERGAFQLAYRSRERVLLGQAILVELGHIVPFEVSNAEIAAAEYEDAMAAQDMIDSLTP